MTNTLSDLTSFLNDLERRGISYTLAHYRDDAIVVTAAVPGERWEIEFLDDGSVEIERFRSDGQIYGIEALDEFFARYAEEATKDPRSPEVAELAIIGKE